MNDSTGLCYYEHMSALTPISIEPLVVTELVEEYVEKLATTVRPDYLTALKAASVMEEDERGHHVLKQLLANATMAAEEGLPTCQDTGYVWVCLEVSGDVLVPADIFAGVDAAVARASERGGLRKSIMRDALIERVNTNTNTPTFCEVMLKRSITSNPLDSEEKELPLPPSATLHIMLKGGGSDNASALAMLPPGAGIDGVLDFVEQAVSAKGANACPPLVVGVGVGSTFDKVAGLAKHALLRTIGSGHPQAEIAELEATLLARINALGIGPSGLGGSTTALAVHIESAPAHIAALPVAVNLGCTAMRSVSLPLLAVSC